MTEDNNNQQQSLEGLIIAISIKDNKLKIDFGKGVDIFTARMFLSQVLMQMNDEVNSLITEKAIMYILAKMKDVNATQKLFNDISKNNIVSDKKFTLIKS